METEGDHIVGAPGRQRGRDWQRGGRRHRRRQLRFSFEIEPRCLRGVGEFNGFVFVGVGGGEGEAEVGGEVVASISDDCHGRIHDAENRFYRVVGGRVLDTGPNRKHNHKT
ncbi:unnamed protein product [Cuscuta epithymum]|uniref:Uncharacterized protein n=1 Tax=Cuscuta epithymum TaxID=186058 RepID=A0AAV0CD98_9ASTE|nr:unnamed protein product [Cuscuta epithymum]